MIGLKDAVKGAPVAAFWPTVASVILYSESSTNTNLIILIVMAFVSSMTYITMRQVKMIFKEAKNSTSRKRKYSRGRKSKSKTDYMREVFDKTMHLLPNSKKVKVFIGFCILTDVLGLLVFFFIFANKVLSGTALSATVTGFTLLPVTYLFVIVCVLIWNK